MPAIPWEQFGVLGACLGAVICILFWLIKRMMHLLESTMEKFANAIIEFTRALQTMSERLASIDSDIKAHRAESQINVEELKRGHEHQRVEHEKAALKLDVIQAAVGKG